MSKQLGIRQAILLLEATRRYNRFHYKENILTASTGLGYISEYQTVINGGYMKPVNNGISIPRCKQGFKLTKKGASIVKKLLYYGINSPYIESTDTKTLINKINYAYKLVQSYPDYPKYI